MRIEIKTGGDKVIVAAVNDDCGLVAVGHGECLGEATKDLISKFAKYQNETIEALNASGIIRWVSKESMS